MIRPLRTGSTMVELVVSLIIASVLVVGMGSSILLASRAGDPNLGGERASARSGEALSDLHRELGYAVAVNAAASTSQQIECTIPDVTGDAVNDTVRYSWSGVAGAALQRTLNGGTPRSVVDNVHAFQLQYRQREREGGSATESAEVQWVDQATAGSADYYDIEAGVNGIGIYFAPTLPPDATAWRIKRIEIRARQVNNPTGAFSSQVWLADSSHLPGTLREEVIVSESNLATTISPYQIQFPGVSTFGATQKACVTFVHHSGSGTAAQIEYGTGSSGSANTSKLTYQTILILFQAWTEQTNEDLRIRIWGSYTGPPGTGEQEFYYTNVDARLQVGTTVNATFHQGIRLINTPEAPGP